MVDVVERDARHRELVEQLFQSSYGELVGLATLVTGDRQVGEDVAQDAFAGLLRRGPLDDPGAAVGYLRRSVVNLARGRLRRRAVADRPHAAPPPATTGATPVEDNALADDDARAVAAALARLPLRQRECVAACTLLGLSHAEAAAVLGVSTGSVKTHLHRGTRRLATLLAAHDPRFSEEAP